MPASMFHRGNVSDTTDEATHGLIDLFVMVSDGRAEPSCLLLHLNEMNSRSEKNGARSFIVLSPSGNTLDPPA